MVIHSSWMDCRMGEVDFAELAKLTQGFDEALLRALCFMAVQAALGRDADQLDQADFLTGIHQLRELRKRDRRWHLGHVLGSVWLG